MSGNKYILVLADYFTRWTEAYPIPDQEASTVAKKLTDEFFFRFSPPEQLHSDQGRNFESAVIAEMCKLLAIKKSRTTAYHPQSDGLVERFNRTLLSMIATAASERPFHWEDHLRALCMAYNSSVHPTTGFTPFYLMLGRQARMPIDIMYGTPGPEPVTVSEYAARLRQNLESAYDYVRNRMGHALDRQKDIYDKKVHGEPFTKGDLVWLHCPAVPRGQSKKLHRPWSGPYRIVSKLSEEIYRIQNMQRRNQRLVVHFNRLKSCPPDIRLTDPAPVSVQNHSRSPPNPSLGEGIELLEYDDAPATPVQPTSRYPRRVRRPPDYFADYIQH